MALRVFLYELDGRAAEVRGVAQTTAKSRVATNGVVGSGLVKTRRAFKSTRVLRWEGSQMGIGRGCGRRWDNCGDWVYATIRPSLLAWRCRNSAVKVRVRAAPGDSGRGLGGFGPYLNSEIEIVREASRGSREVCLCPRGGVGSVVERE